MGRTVCSLEGFTEEIQEFAEDNGDDEVRAKLYQFSNSINEIILRLKVQLAKRETLLLVAAEMEKEGDCSGTTKDRSIQPE